MRTIDLGGGVCAFQAMVEMRDGVRLNTFVYLPAAGGPRFPGILQRTPYGITSAEGKANFDVTRGWLPADNDPMRGSILRGYRAIVEHGYVAIYQDTRGRYGSEGEDRVYADDAYDGYDTLAWIASQTWSNHCVGMSGSSAGATTTFAAASQRHPSLRCFFAQVGGSSIYDDVVYEGQSIEMERLWLWVSRNIPGLSRSHREAVKARFQLTDAELDAAATRAAERWSRLDAAARADPPFIGNEDWLRLPLARYPDFSTWQPFLDEILTHPAPDAFRGRHNFRRTIDIPGFYATTWFDIFQTSVIAAFSEVQARVGNQKLWIGPNDHYYIYERNFWPRDPYFQWFGYWLKDEPTSLIDEPPVFYSPCAWVEDRKGYVANDWRHAERWPPPAAKPRRLYLRMNGTLGESPGDRGILSYRYDPRKPIPSFGGRNMQIEAGSRDQRPAQALPGYGLIYRSAPLSADIQIAGSVRVRLNVESDCPDTDFIAKLIEVDSEGRAMLLMDGVVRAMYRDGVDAASPLVPNQIYTVTIELAHIHHLFRAGHRVEVDITSSNFPRRARNTNSGNPVIANDTERDIRVANNRVHHGEGTPSYVELPVLA